GNTNRIGGTQTTDLNLIAGNTGDGIDIIGAGNLVQGNLIGSDLTGLNALPNGGSGIGLLGGASGNTIGGTVNGSLNLISGNTQSGITITGGGAINNLVQGNLIGTDINGTAPLGNGVSGITITSGASSNTIG